MSRNYLAESDVLLALGREGEAMKSLQDGLNHYSQRMVSSMPIPRGDLPLVIAALGMIKEMLSRRNPEAVPRAKEIEERALENCYLFSVPVLPEE